VDDKEVKKIRGEALSFVAWVSAFAVAAIAPMFCFLVFAYVSWADQGRSSTLSKINEMPEEFFLGGVCLPFLGVFAFFTYVRFKKARLKK
jgi:H+/Cl- antiporter ClcA